MAGTFGGALEARKIDASRGKLVAEARGEIESEERVLIIKRIHVSFTLKTSEQNAAVVERVHGMFARSCPVYRSLEKAIEITSSYTLVDVESEPSSPAPGE
jgi:uncharacterized OsmC-like protein